MGAPLRLQAARKSFTRIINSLPQPPTFLPFLPKPGDAPIPVLLPTPSGQPVPVVAEPNKLLEVNPPPPPLLPRRFVLHNTPHHKISTPFARKDGSHQVEHPLDIEHAFILFLADLSLTRSWPLI